MFLLQEITKIHSILVGESKQSPDFWVTLRINKKRDSFLLTNAFNSITETVPESAEADCVGKYLFLMYLSSSVAGRESSSKPLLCVFYSL